MERSFLLSVSLSIVLCALVGCQTAAVPPVEPEQSSVVPVPDVSSIHVGDDHPKDLTQDLEYRVQTLESQMKIAQPTLKKVDAIESHFKALSFELGKISEAYHVDDEKNSEPVATKSVVSSKSEDPVKTENKKSTPVQASPKKESVQKPVIKSDVFAVTSVRIGEQGKDMTRIVLDTTKAAEINYDLDNAEGLLVIEIPKAKWSTTESQVFQKSPMIKSFRALSDEQGVRFVADLKQKAKVVATARLTPSGTSGHRVYVDIAPAQ